MYRLRRAMNGFVLASLLVSLIGWRATPSNAAMATVPQAVDQRAVEVAAGGRILGLSPDGMPLVVKRETAICIQDAAPLAETSCAAWDMEGVHQESFVWSPDSTKGAGTKDAAQYLVDSDLWVPETATGDLTNLTDDGERDDLVDAIANDAPFQADSAALAARQDTAQGTDGPTSGSITGVTEAKVAIRDAPSTGAPIVLVVTSGTELEITGGIEEGDGFTWLPVRDPATETTGYVPEPFLSLPAAVSMEVTTVASPTPQATDEPGSLPAMLARVPASMVDPAALEGDFGSYADIAAQLDAVGVPRPTGADREELGDSISATSGLALPSALQQHAVNEQWRETFGFDIFQVDQSLLVGQPPNTVMFLRGNFDEAELRAAWARSGYEEIEVDDTVVASVAEEPEVDLNSPVGRLALGSMNNAVILTDGTLVFAGSLESIEAILDVEADDAPSLAEQSSMSNLLAATPEDLATALLVPGEALRGTETANLIIGGLTDEELDAVATRIATEGDQTDIMPPIRLALIGITPGGPLATSDAGDTGGQNSLEQPEARIEITLLLANRSAAEQAAAVVLSRLAQGTSNATGAPYADFYPERDAVPSSEEPVLLVTLETNGRPVRVIFEMYYRRDLGFLAW